MTPHQIVDRVGTWVRGNLPPGITTAQFDWWWPQVRDGFVDVVREEQERQAEPPSAAGWPDDLTDARARGAANVRAMQLVARGGTLSPAELRAVALYSGWGGVGHKPYASRFPPGFPVPETRGLLHEYYTPSKVWRAVADAAERLVRRRGRPWPVEADGRVAALEPSAGIGRALRAFGWRGEIATGIRYRWTALEQSGVSARFLRALHPDAEVVEGFAESWIASNIGRRSFGLVAANPPYGARGEAKELDGSGYNTKQAYVYFTVRTAELLKQGGLGIYIIPTGFLTSRTALFERHRSELLRRVHLLGAVRLPSVPEEGGSVADVAYDQFVVDVLFVEGRGGIAAAPAVEDRAVIEGGYFEAHPRHILGRPIGELTATEDAPSVTKARRGYQVVGTFTEIPDFEPRPLVAIEVTAGKAATKVRGGIGRDERRGELAPDAPVRLLSAEGLGRRVDRYLASVAAGGTDAGAGHAELREDLQAWQRAYGVPEADAGLAAVAQAGNVYVARFLSVWRGATLGEAISRKPETRTAYTGREGVAGFASWLFKRLGGLPLPLSRLVTEHRAAGIGSTSATAPDLLFHLLRAGWCLSGAQWDHVEPATHYYTGFLWPKFDEASEHARLGHPNAAAQRDELKRRIGWVAGPAFIKQTSPDQPWIPHDVLLQWAALRYVEEPEENVVVGANWPANVGLQRKDGLTYPSHIEGYGALVNTDKERTPGFDRFALCFVGWLNQDKTLFAPPRRTDEDDKGNKVTISADVIRLEMERAWQRSWRAWLGTNTAALDRLEEEYNRRLRGYIAPAWSQDEIRVARWGPKVTLHGYQNEGAAKLIGNGAGLLAFDVGLGKTYSGIKVLAKMREEGRARRPAIVVPNTIVWKWVRDIAKCLPDYRVLVIGSNRVKNKLGRWTAKNDTPAERAVKWADFQAGLYDVVLCTYSAFWRQQISRAFVDSYVSKQVSIRRAVTLQIEQLEAEADAKAGKEGKEKGPKRRTERGEADLVERTRAWVGDKLALPKGWEYDPGIDWHALGIDFLMVDEAQNFKNLFYSVREGSADRAAAKRAWAMDFRCASVRHHSGGGGVVLLSATPMKNAATEFFNLLYLVNPAIWAQVGVEDPEGFISMFARIEDQKITTGTAGQAVRQLVTGFNHADALKGVVFRWATFRNAKQVGLKIPDVHRTQHLVRATEEQKETFGELFAELADIEEKMKNVMRASQGGKDPKFAQTIRILRMKKQGVATRLYLCSIHPGLVENGSQSATAGPKLVACADVIAATKPTVCEVPDKGWKLRPGDCNADRAGCDETQDAWCLTCGHIVFAENVKVHYWLRELLVARGIPRERIAILNAEEAKDLELRQQIAEGFNGKGRPDDDTEEYEAPRFDVVIANAVAYEGIDLQVRTCTIHNLDVPYEPATLQQRHGRGVRQGARFPLIGLHFYFVQGSNEAFRLQKIERKRGIMLDLYGEGDVATNTVVADEVMSEDSDTLDAFIDFAPPHLKAQLLRAAAEERARQEAEAAASARKAANGALRDAIAATRRARRNVGTEREDATAQAAADAVADLARFPASLWSYPWRQVAQLVLDSDEPYALGPTGPALFEGARWQLRPAAPPIQAGEGVETRPATDAGEDDRPFVAVEITDVTDETAVWARRADLLPALDRAATLPDAEQVEWRWGWTPEQEAEDTENLRHAGPLNHAGSLIHTPGVSWRHLGAALQRALWTQNAGRLAERFPSWAKAGDYWKLPMYVDGELALYGEPNAGVLNEHTVLPRTPEGWITFQALARRQTRLGHVKLADIARSWWGLELPTGTVGRDVPGKSQGAKGGVGETGVVL